MSEMLVSHSGSFARSRVSNCELLSEGIERDPDVLDLVVVRDHLFAFENGVETRQALLAIYDHLQSGRCAGRRAHSVAVHRCGRRPEQEVARRIAVVERVEEITHARSLPDERTLQVRQAQLAAVDLLHQCADRMLRVGEALCRHARRSRSRASVGPTLGRQTLEHAARCPRKPARARPVMAQSPLLL